MKMHNFTIFSITSMIGLMDAGDADDEWVYKKIQYQTLSPQASW